VTEQIWIVIGIVGGLILGLILWIMGTVIVARSRSKDLECPKCGSLRVRPSWPKHVEGILGVLSVRPYRCESCRVRFYGPWVSRHEPAQQVEES
jgi:hypothetical protein